MKRKKTDKNLKQRETAAIIDFESNLGIRHSLHTNAFVMAFLTSS